MEFGYFIIFFGLIITIIGIMLKFKGQLTPKNPNCPADVYDAKQMVKYQKILTILGLSIILVGILIAVVL